MTRLDNTTFRGLLLGSLLCTLSVLFPPQADAGVPECGGLRLEDAGRCEIKGSVDCSGGCSELGIYKKACATRLHTSCRQECTLSAMPSCTDECTEVCQTRCDAGEDITCIHNCFSECSGSCDASCAGADDLDTCMASCEATCDGECDIKCAPVVEASCYEHCIECCGGSCGAQANMDCQTSCQEVEFEECEYDLRVECDLSCSGDGALFCDGEYVLSGDQMPGCVRALVQRGIDATAEASAEINDALDELDEAAGSARVSSRGGCRVGLGKSRATTSPLWFALGVAAARAARGRRRARRSR